MRTVAWCLWAASRSGTLARRRRAVALFRQAVLDTHPDPTLLGYLRARFPR